MTMDRHRAKGMLVAAAAPIIQFSGGHDAIYPAFGASWNQGSVEKPSE